MIVVLGELGGRDDYYLVDALKHGKVAKPILVWVSGTSARPFKLEVEFGHAGAMSGGDEESAQTKNMSLTDAGVIVPTSFEGLEATIKATYNSLVEKKVITPVKNFVPLRVPEDLNAKIKSGKVRGVLVLQGVLVRIVEKKRNLQQRF